MSVGREEGRRKMENGLLTSGREKIYTKNDGKARSPHFDAAILVTCRPPIYDRACETRSRAKKNIRSPKKGSIGGANHKVLENPVFSPVLTRVSSSTVATPLMPLAVS